MIVFFEDANLKLGYVDDVCLLLFVIFLGTSYDNTDEFSKKFQTPLTPPHFAIPPLVAVITYQSYILVAGTCSETHEMYHVGFFLNWHMIMCR